MNAKGYSARDEQRLLDALGRGLLKEFPNPERSGCPGADVLRRIAFRTMPLKEAEMWLDHLGSCSPCYGDFSELQKAHELRQKRALLAIAASILLAAGIAGWVLFQKHNETLVARTAVLDLRNRSVARGAEPNPAEQPLDVDRGVRHWTIYLPLGSSDGRYDVRILAPSGASVLTTSGIARLTDSITSLQVDVSLAASRPGRYILQVRRATSEWIGYELLVR